MRRNKQSSNTSLSSFEWFRNVEKEEESTETNKKQAGQLIKYFSIVERKKLQNVLNLHHDHLHIKHQNSKSGKKLNENNAK
ncbi:CLUMA_CG020229, isoform A [Clunio marinus]|uniref:CLUMA_CG020229, isoform A n=1 Tax=Clunio marinus TaxID=568069 RepID=A0A1J1J8M1_9DIPT|nr:CLUMA_CG020229, isoform A [Clunio marinus]